MDNFRERRQKNYVLMRRVRDITMAILILFIGALMFFSDRIGLELTIEPLLRYIFGGLCLLYGSFRLYRGIKSDYLQ